MARAQALTESRWMRARALLLAGALLLGFGAVLVRAAKVQLFDRSRLSRLQRDQTRRELEWAPRRGMILDRRGQRLAVTGGGDSMFVYPSAFDTARAREKAAVALASALHMEKKRVLEKLSQPEKKFAWL